MRRDRKGRGPEYRRGHADGRLAERASAPDPRFWMLDRAGWAAWWLGSSLYGAGLTLCSLAGFLDAWADSYEDGGALARRAQGGAQ